MGRLRSTHQVHCDHQHHYYYVYCYCYYYYHYYYYYYHYFYVLLDVYADLKAAIFVGSTWSTPSELKSIVDAHGEKAGYTAGMKRAGGNSGGARIIYCKRAGKPNKLKPVISLKSKVCK
jgi:hypothetical protein